MIDIRQLHRFVVRPALDHLGLPGGLAAERLVIGTGLTESGLVYLDQKGRGGETGWGPALGLWQMERATFNDHMRWLQGRQSALGDKVRMLEAPWSPGDDPWKQLAGNLSYAAAMTRIHYWRRPEKLPAADDLDGMARMWKTAYNTVAGAGREVDFKVKAAPVMTLVA